MFISVASKQINGIRQFIYAQAESESDVKNVDIIVSVAVEIYLLVVIEKKSLNCEFSKN